MRKRLLLAAASACLIAGTSLLSADARKKLADAPAAGFESSKDPAIVFARRGLVAWKGQGLYPDANFTLRAAACTARRRAVP